MFLVKSLLVGSGKVVAQVAGKTTVRDAFSSGTLKAAEGTGAQTLFHYTNEQGMKGILESGELRPSVWKTGTKDVRYGNGQYLSDIPPGTRTPAELSRDFIGQPFQGQKYTHYIEVDVTDLGVVKGRDGVFVIPGDTPLDVSNRVITTGKN